jgi:cell wall-associated NlpC family hydrolase
VGAELAYQYALTLLGTPYIWGGNSPIMGLDCSGKSILILQSQALLPYPWDGRVGNIYRYLLNHGGTSIAKPQRGAFVFFGKSFTDMSHIGFCVNPLVMIHAGGGDSSVKTLADAIKKQAFVKMQPIHYRRDIIDFVMPNYPVEG